MPQNPLEHLKALIGRYTVITYIPDIDRYRRITSPRPGRCIFRGCPEPIAWEDAQGGNFLCEGHYQTVKTWIEEARKELLPGGHLSPLFMQGGDDGRSV